MKSMKIYTVVETNPLGARVLAAFTEYTAAVQAVIGYNRKYGTHANPIPAKIDNTDLFVGGTPDIETELAVQEAFMAYVGAVDDFHDQNVYARTSSDSWHRGKANEDAKRQALRDALNDTE